MVFIKTPVFTEDLLELLSDDEYKEMQKTLLLEPETGDLTQDQIKLLKSLVKGVTT